MTHEGWSGSNRLENLNLHKDVARREPNERSRSPAAPWQRRLVIGITAFRRPRHLERLVASIQQRYPDVSIVVADNGDAPAALPASVKVIHLPFDCGLSRARNALVSATHQEYFLLLEEDFQFTAETRIQDFVDVLEHDPEVGVVGGSLLCNGVKQDYAVRIDRHRDQLRLSPAVGGHRVTPQGVTYQICDMCFNFALFRRAMLRDHLWNEHLKLGEHYAY
ncbi:MAG: glycosyltransferase family 2 protein [Planctomycetaceae bacterium]|nr:glycosyltransferase family 2 protein [Planctomycetaceae bacterium]